VDGRISGVRVLAHRETPGLGDKIEVERDDWILDFDGRSLSQPPRERWRVRRDGGAFDQFTGATITARAVVSAVRDALIYFSAHRDELFAAPAAAEEMPLPEAAEETE
jgi:Na+-translocating ferredoxin:NAD+ oxidoreductase subunit G